MKMNTKQEQKVILWVEVGPDMYQRREDALKYDLVSNDPGKQRTTYRINRSKPVKSKEDVKGEGVHTVNIFVKTIAS